MDQEQRHSWSATPTGPGEDFSDFLEFDDVDLSFSQSEGISRASNAPHDTMEVSNDGFTQELDASQLPTPMSTAYPSGDSLAEIALQQQFFQQRSHQHRSTGVLTGGQHTILQTNQGPQSHYYGHGMVPPTPNSIEMQGAQVHAFTDPQALGMYESNKNQDQMIFTPLVSPAFQLQDLGTTGEYFSPLTSPALEAQEYARAVSSTGECDRRDLSTPGSTLKKAKRRANPNQKDPVHAVRYSPAMKAQHKRYSGSGKTPKEVAEIVAGLGSLNQTSPGLGNGGRASALRSQANSETGSISPEPLSEVLMPPPAAPRSGSHGRSNQSSPQDAVNAAASNSAPATPASLFRIQRPENSSIHSPAGQQSQSFSTGKKTPQTSEPSTSNLNAQDSETAPGTSVTNNIHLASDATASVMLASPLNSGASSPSFGQKQTIKDIPSSARGNKKRSSSSHMSPALRPRISPSIKPLLPGVASYDSEATATLLANKSNYERIIDGSASQLGVSYSAHLSENLTSKRTSHKIAEQGRRNRINTALSEIQALLPDDFGKDSAENTGGGGSGASKAKTVENAIEYIKCLKAELLSAREDLMLARSKMEQLQTQGSQEKGSKI